MRHHPEVCYSLVTGTKQMATVFKDAEANTEGIVKTAGHTDNEPRRGNLDTEIGRSLNRARGEIPEDLPGS
jgi:hypothetical protein